MSTHSIPSKILLLASTTILISGLMQLGTAWLQYHAAKPIPTAASGQLRAAIADKYTWIGDDFPNALPLDLEAVALTIENSRHYAPDSLDANAEYQSMYPGELGFLRLGPNHRFFGIAMYHQLHCLDSLRSAIVHGGTWHDNHPGRAGGKREQVPHVHHCLNYLRQTILCSADLTLEPEIVLGSQDVGEGLAVTHVCRDWGSLHEFIERNYESWKTLKNSTRDHVKFSL